MENVHKVLGKRCAVTGSETFVGRQVRKQWGLTGELLTRIVFIVLQITPPEQRMLAIGREVVIKPRYIRVPFQMDRRVEPEPKGVQPVAHSAIVRRRILVEYRQHRGVRTGTTARAERPSIVFTSRRLCAAGTAAAVPAGDRVHAFQTDGPRKRTGN